MNSRVRVAALGPFSEFDGVATRAALTAAGPTRGVLRTALSSGRWQEPLPGVLVNHGGPLSPTQQRRMALIYAWPGAALSHRTAGRLHGLTVEEPVVEVVVAHGRRLSGAGRCLVHQTNRPPRTIHREGLACTPVDRTVVDIAVGMRNYSDVVALVSSAVQRGLTTVARITAETEHAPRRGSGHLQGVLEEVTAGVRSAGEGDFLRLIRQARLPEPELNARVLTPCGPYFLDALWRPQRVGAEIDGQAWHLDAASWEADLRRQNAIAATGLRLLRFSVRRIRREPASVTMDLRRALLL